MTPDELRSELSRLGLSQVGAAKVLDYDERSVRRWVTGDKPIPRAVALLLPKLTPKEAARLSGDVARRTPAKSPG